MLNKLMGITLLSLLVLGPTMVFGRSSRPTVVHGAATFQQNGANWNIQTNKNKTIINWHTFDVPEGSVTKFTQPKPNSAVLNRVTGPLFSGINGSLISNGKVFLINPNGIVVGRNGVINTRGFVGSTLSIDDSKFLRAGSIHFEGDSNATIVNLGHIEASGGDVILISSQVENRGTIVDARGKVALVAARDVVLTKNHQIYIVPSESNDSQESDALEEDATGVVNSGEIHAVRAELLARGNMYALAINNSGIVNATGVVREGGRVLLRADGGMIENTGTLQAQTIRKNGKSEGGDIQVLGDTVVLDGTASLKASGDLGGGNINVGGSYQGKGPLPNAQAVWVGSQVNLEANALEVGDGGKIILWSDHSNWFYGSAEAKGGLHGGNGGFTEVSGKQHLTYAGQVDLTAPQGELGTLLLDPTNGIIKNGSGTGGFTSGGGQIFGNAVGADPTVIFESELELMLSTANVIIQMTNNLVVEDLSDGVLDMTLATGTLELKADSDGINGGDFVMMDTTDVIKTQGGEVHIHGANLTLGKIDTSAGAGGHVTLSVTDSTLGLITLRNDIVTRGGNINFDGNVKLEATGVTVTSGLANVQFGGTVNGSSFSALMVNSSGKTFFNGAVGNVNMLAGLSTDAGGETIFRTDQVDVDGGMVFNDNVLLGNSVRFLATGGDVVFNGTLNATVAGQESVEVDAAGIVKFKAIGNTKELNVVTAEGQGLIFDGNVRANHMDLLAGGNGVTLNGNVGLAADPLGDITINTQGISQLTGTTLYGNALHLSGSGAFVLKTSINVLHTESQINGFLSVTNDKSFSVGSPGIDVFDGIQLTTTSGSISIDNEVFTNSIVVLDSAAGVDGSAEVIAQELLLLGSGTFKINTFVDTIASGTLGSGSQIDIFNSKALTVGFVNSFSGLSIDGDGAISLTTTAPGFLAIEGTLQANQIMLSTQDALKIRADMSTGFATGAGSVILKAARVTQSLTGSTIDTASLELMSQGGTGDFDINAKTNNISEIFTTGAGVAGDLTVVTTATQVAIGDIVTTNGSKFYIDHKDGELNLNGDIQLGGAFFEVGLGSVNIIQPGGVTISSGGGQDISFANMIVLNENLTLDAGDSASGGAILLVTDGVSVTDATAGSHTLDMTANQFSVFDIGTRLHTLKMTTGNDLGMVLTTGVDLNANNVVATSLSTASTADLVVATNFTGDSLTLNSQQAVDLRSVINVNDLAGFLTVKSQSLRQNGGEVNASNVFLESQNGSTGNFSLSQKGNTIDRFFTLGAGVAGTIDLSSDAASTALNAMTTTNGGSLFINHGTPLIIEGPVNLAGGFGETGGGTVALQGSLTVGANNDISFGGALTIGGGVAGNGTPTLTTSGTGGISLNQVSGAVTGANFNVNAGNGGVTLNGTLGTASNALGLVNINTAGGVSQVGTQTIFADTLQVGGRGPFVLSTSLNHLASNGKVTGSMVITNNKSLSLDGIDVSLNGRFIVTNGNITINQDLTVGGLATLNATAGATGPGTVRGTSLLLRGSGNFNLNTSVGTLASANLGTGSITVRNDGTLNVGSINGQVGLTASGIALSTASGGINLDGSLDANGGVVLLATPGGVGQGTAGTIVDASGLLLLGAGTFDLGQSNSVGTIAADINGRLIFANQGNMRVGSIGGVNGIRTNGNDVTLQSGGTLTLASGIDAGAGSVALNITSGGVSQLVGGAIQTGGLQLFGSGDFVLDKVGNNVPLLAAQISSGNLILLTDGNLTVGDIGGFSGIDAPDATLVSLAAPTGFVDLLATILADGSGTGGKVITGDVRPAGNLSTFILNGNGRVELTGQPLNDVPVEALPPPPAETTLNPDGNLPGDPLAPGGDPLAPGGDPLAPGDGDGGGDDARTDDGGADEGGDSGVTGDAGGQPGSSPVTGASPLRDFNLETLGADSEWELKLPKELVKAKVTLDNILGQGFDDEFLGLAGEEIRNSQKGIGGADQALARASRVYHALPAGDPVKLKIGKLMKVLKLGRREVKSTIYLLDHFLTLLYLEKKRDRMNQDAFKGALEGLRSANEYLALTTPTLHACSEAVQSAARDIPSDALLNRVLESARLAFEQAKKETEQIRKRRDRAYNDVLLFDWEH